MSAPELLLIKRMEDLYTGWIGRCNDGQFFITESNPIAGSETAKREWVYVTRYLFALDGKFFNAKHAKIACAAGNDYLNLAEEKKRAFLDELGPFVFRDINVKPFAVTIDGVRFGLICNAALDSIDLEPGPIITFMEPWDGEYYT